MMLRPGIAFSALNFNGRSDHGERDTKWAEGLLGVASLFLCISRIIEAYLPEMLEPGVAWWKGPFFRLPAQSSTWVALFFLMTIYINSMKPLRQIRAGVIDAMPTSLAQNLLRYTARLVFPITIATLFGWILCQFGAFEMARKCESWWQMDMPAQASNLWEALVQLWQALLNAWAFTMNPYDENQWTLMLLLKTTYAIYLALMATGYTSPRKRMGIIIALHAYAVMSSDSLLSISLTGVLFAEITLDPTLDRIALYRPLHTRVAAMAMIVLGLYIASYPYITPEISAWSARLQRLFSHIFPIGMEDHWYDGSGALWRFIPGAGVQLMVLGIMLSSDAQTVLGHPLLVGLGAISLPIYVLEAPLRRSILTWMVLAGAKRVQHWRPGNILWGDPPWINEGSYYILPQQIGRFVWAVPLWLALVIWCSILWNRWVVPFYERIIARMDEFFDIGGARKTSHLPRLNLDREGVVIPMSSLEAPLTPP